MREKLLILDFGSQYTQLIARRVRELGVYCEIHPYSMDLEQLALFMMNGGKGIILSGGPSSVTDPDAPMISGSIFHMGWPILGICYGQQLMVRMLAGQGSVKRSGACEYGRANALVLKTAGPFRDFMKDDLFQAWMSHGDSVEYLPHGFEAYASSERDGYTAIGDSKRHLYGMQFHPEVADTPQGSLMLYCFLEDCGFGFDWKPGSIVEEKIQQIRDIVGDESVVCGLSGGVDSMVAAKLIDLAIGDRLRCVFVNNGLLRQDEVEDVCSNFEYLFGRKLEVYDASEKFVSALAGVVDPEQKRKVIGRLFVEAFTDAVSNGEKPAFLAQGTLYPDVIESISVKGPSAVIKSHHNVGGLPEALGFKLLEPFRELFKDEVRAIGEELEIPDEIVHRQPFPGPGLAVRILGEVTEERLETLRKADAIVREGVDKADARGLEDLWQAFAVLLPVRTVGVMGDERTYDEVCAIRVVTSTDGMTADWARVDYEVLASISARIVNEVKGINRVVYDITTKPPSTIEWE